MLKAIYASIIMTATLAATAAQAQIPAPKGPVEAKYRADGPWTVSTVATTTACDRENKLCDIYYPTNLGTNPIKGLSSGFKHPVIVWANGTGIQSPQYGYYLRHLASWGFIVIASRDDGTGSGGTTIDAANYIIGRGNTSGNIFFGKVDGTNVGASGHSQGGSTILKLASNNTAPFKAYVPIHGVGGFFGLLCCGLTTNNLASVQSSRSILFMGATGDNDNANENIAFYNATAAGASKAVGILKTSGHSDIFGSPTCSVCVIGSYGYLGYPTAWFMWKLQGATDVQVAFKASGGEFMAAHAGWNFNNSNVP